MRKECWYGPAVLLLIWAGLTYPKLVNPVLVPTPGAVAVKFVTLLGLGTIWPDLLASLYRLTLGFALAVGIGVPLGLLIGSSRRLVESLEFLIDFFRSLPASALFPMFILFFGIGDRSKVAVIVFSCALIILVNAIYGVKNCKEARLRAARAMGANRMVLFTKVIFPEALPHIFAGLRVSVSIGLILVVVTEMFIGTHRGLGQRIYDAHLMFRIAEMYAVILLTGILGYVLNKVFITVEAKVFHWAGR